MYGHQIKQKGKGFYLSFIWEVKGLTVQKGHRMMVSAPSFCGTMTVVISAPAPSPLDRSASSLIISEPLFPALLRIPDVLSISDPGSNNSNRRGVGGGGTKFPAVLPSFVATNITNVKINLFLNSSRKNSSFLTMVSVPLVSLCSTCQREKV